LNPDGHINVNSDQVWEQLSQDEDLLRDINQQAKAAFPWLEGSGPIVNENDYIRNEFKPDLLINCVDAFPDPDGGRGDARGLHKHTGYNPEIIEGLMSTHEQTWLDVVINPVCKAVHESRDKLYKSETIRRRSSESLAANAARPSIVSREKDHWTICIFFCNKQTHRSVAGTAVVTPALNIWAYQNYHDVVAAAWNAGSNGWYERRKCVDSERSSVQKCSSCFGGNAINHRARLIGLTVKDIATAMTSHDRTMNLDRLRTPNAD
jgi:hypothetical protein